MNKQKFHKNGFHFGLRQFIAEKYNENVLCFSFTIEFNIINELNFFLQTKDNITNINDNYVFNKRILLELLTNIECLSFYYLIYEEKNEYIICKFIFGIYNLLGEDNINNILNNYIEYFSILKNEFEAMQLNYNILSNLIDAQTYWEELLINEDYENHVFFVNYYNSNERNRGIGISYSEALQMGNTEDPNQENPRSMFNHIRGLKIKLYTYWSSIIYAYYINNYTNLIFFKNNIDKKINKYTIINIWYNYMIYNNYYCKNNKLYDIKGNELDLIYLKNNFTEIIKLFRFKILHQFNTDILIYLNEYVEIAYALLLSNPNYYLPTEEKISFIKREIQFLIECNKGKKRKKICPIDIESNVFDFLCYRNFFEKKEDSYW